jgi:hypothetical protein
MAADQIERFKTTFYQGYRAARDRPDLTVDEAWAIMLRAPFLAALSERETGAEYSARITALRSHVYVRTGVQLSEYVLAAILSAPAVHLGQEWVSRVTSSSAPDVAVIGGGEYRCTCTPLTDVGIMAKNPTCPAHGTPAVKFTVEDQR